MTLASEKSGILLVMVAASLWATVGVGAQLVPASAGLAPELLGFARTAIAGPVILMLAIGKFGLGRITAARINPSGLLLFAVSNAVFQVGLFRCFTLLGVTITVFLTVCLPPIIAMVFGWFQRREEITAGNVIALGYSVAGLGLIAVNNDIGRPTEAQISGLALAVITSIAFVTMSSAARSASRTSPPLLFAGAGLSLSSLVIFLLLPIANVPDISRLIPSLADPSVLGLVLYLGLGPTALAYICYCKGIAKSRSSFVALTATMIEPAVAALLAIWILADSPSTTETMGCMLLMMAMLILWQSEQKLALKRAGTSNPIQPLNDL